MPGYVYELREAPDDASLVGGKAAGLGRLLRAGLPVPPGFAIGADAFRSFLRETSLDRDRSASRDGTPPSETEALALLRGVRWPDELRSAIETAYAGLQREQPGPVAVRSSATAEDGAGASFAGQHATILNLGGREAVLDAILACWASLYSSAAVDYRRGLGVVDDGPAMAVVVQALVPAEASGVAFTVDPVTGDGDLVLIDAAWGLGEGIVGGVVSPDHFAVRKADGAIARREIAEKRLRIAAAPGGGTRNETLDAEQAASPALSDGQAVELARLAGRVEELTGGPQDIEWALAEGRFSLLQARPVTAAGVADGEDEGWVSEFDTPTAPDTVWTAANVQEVLPGEISPFNCSITTRMVEIFGTKPLDRMGIRVKTPDPFGAFFYSRAFLNVTMTMEVVDQTPFGATDAMMEQYYDIPRDLLPKPTPLSPAKVWRYALMLPRIVWFVARYRADVRRAERIVGELERSIVEQPYRELPDEELVSVVDAGLEPSAEVSVTHVSGAGLTGASFDMLRSVTRSWLGDEDGALHATLCSGLAGLESAQPAYELWELSRLVVASERLSEAFAPAAGAEIERRLSALDGEEVATFRHRLDGFLGRHGHRSVMEAEVAAQSWSEDLPTVFAMIRNYLHAGESLDPRRVEERQRHEREEATRQALARLRWWQRPMFRFALRGAHRWVVSREHTKSLMVRSTDRARRLTRELARRFTERGVLGDAWDFYYLTLEEVKALVRGELNATEARLRIRRRRDEEARNRGVVLPETFQGRPKPLRPEDLPLPEGDTLRGIAVSPGRVTGRARVILDPRRDAAIEPGEILVAPVTDAGWTPLFIAAAGVVVDIGGTLSHGSTVAREYGLPAVVNVKHGTRLIRTGQTITVDGTQGVVVLGDEGSRALGARPA